MSTRGTSDDGHRPPGAGRPGPLRGDVVPDAAPGDDDDGGGWLAGYGWAIRRDVARAFRTRSELGVELAFYAIVITLFPLATAPDPQRLAALGPGVLWVAALLAALLSLPRLFATDHADGTLEQMALSPRPLAALVSGKITAHWLTSGLPVVLATPLAALAYGLDAGDIAVLVAGLALGTPIVSLLGAIGAALTLGVRGGGALLALLVLPLTAPVLIFGAGAVEAARAGLGAEANLSLLGAAFLVAALASPPAAAAAVRIALD